MKILWVSVVLLTTGCVQMILPTPGASVQIPVDRALTNPDLTAQLLVILKENRLTECRGMRQIDNDQRARCSIGMWNSDLTLVDPERALIKIGKFPSYTNNIAGHAARVKRTAADRLKVTVKGAGIYYRPIPNEAVAKQVAEVIAAGLGE